MLHLQRKPLEPIVIGEPGRQILVAVLGLRNGQFHLGLAGPDDVPILRYELVEALDARLAPTLDRLAAMDPYRRPRPAAGKGGR